jgi:predicted ArsR family transcriptional regulator
MFGWGDFAIRRHLARLVEREWVQVSRGPGNQRRYQLVEDGTSLGSAKGAMKGKSSLRDFHSVHGCHGLVP